MNKGERFHALDVLRGIAILGMAFSGLIPNNLPSWMYHAQTPPPERAIKPEIPGLTWVDLVFPFFLFAMGAALPIAMQKFSSTREVVRSLGGRWLLLGAFALLSQHFRIYSLAKSPQLLEATVALLGFALMVGVFWRGPMPAWQRWAGWAALIALVCTWKFSNGKVGFEQGRLDIILMVLANVAFSGGLAWWLTRGKPMARILVMVVVGGLFVAKNEPGLAQWWWNWDPVLYLKPLLGDNYRFVPDLYNMEFHKYLLIVLPGTFAGEAWLRRESHPASWPLGVLGVSASLVACVGLQGRWVIETTLLLWGLCAGMWMLARESEKPFVALAAACLVPGLILEPVAGGIHKDPSHLSYWLVTSGLGALFLLGLMNCRPPFKLVGDCGANPILAYALIANLLPSLNLYTLYGARIGSMVSNPWLVALLDAGVKTALVCALAAWATRRRFFLRA